MAKMIGRRAEGAALAALLGLALAAPAQSAVDIPPRGAQGAPQHSLTFTLPSGNASDLARKHKRACERLGSHRCRVVQFLPDPGNWGGSVSLRMVLARGTAAAFVAELSKSTANASMNLNDNSEADPKRLGELQLEKELAQASLEKLASLQNTAPAERIPLILDQRAQVEANLRRTEGELVSLTNRPKADVVNISYDVAVNRDQARLANELDELWLMFLIGLLAVTGVALLTGLYFGVLGMIFLWLRKIATNRGWLKGKSAPVQAPAAPALIPTSPPADRDPDPTAN